MEFDNDTFELTRKNAEDEYKKINCVWNPYLQEHIQFNSIGFQHLLFKSWNHARNRDDQYIRLKLLRFAKDVIEKSHTLQEYKETNEFVRQKINSRWERKLKVIRYYGFLAITKNRKARIKVIVKEIDGGKKFFFSLIPSWKLEQDVNKKYKKTLYRGIPETD